MAKISLPLIELEVEKELWDSLIRKFSIEGHYRGVFLAKDFLELTTTSHVEVSDAAITDALDLIKFSTRRRFASGLQKKYRIGGEFAYDADANDIFDRVFVSAEATAMGVLRSSSYSFDTLVHTEIFYWVMLQLLRMDRGEFVVKKSQGNQVRLGVNLDLAGDGSSVILDAEHYSED